MTTDDDWKVAPDDMLTVNPHSDQPTKRKDQMIYIQQRSHGVMFVDSDKLLAEFDGGKGPYTMHELAWREKHTCCKEVPRDKKRPVAGLSCRAYNKVTHNSGSFNHMVLFNQIKTVFFLLTMSPKLAKQNYKK